MPKYHVRGTNASKRKKARSEKIDGIYDGICGGISKCCIYINIISSSICERFVLHFSVVSTELLLFRHHNLDTKHVIFTRHC